VVEIDVEVFPFVPEGADPLLPVDPAEASRWHGLDLNEKKEG
jgi:hypothetical protein